MSHIRLLLSTLSCLLLFTACSDDATNNGGSGGTNTDTNSAANLGTDTQSIANTDTNADTSIATGTDTSAVSDTVTNTDTAWGSGACTPFACAGKIYQCGDCLDNDSDGTADARDANCLGPCDNNESGLQINIPGSEPSGCSLECYFDDDNGPGNDHCEWNYLCDQYTQTINDSGKTCALDTDGLTGNKSCEDLRASQETQCTNTCEPLVPNGCDCWGCCQIGNYPHTVYIGTPGCTIDNPDNCDRCDMVPSCGNTCGRCELCLGKTELPSDCNTTWDTDSDTTNDDTDTQNLRCPVGVQPCGLPGDAPCDTNRYCITGCCHTIILG